jgi:hypothetical protein
LTENIATTRPGVKQFSSPLAELGSESYAKAGLPAEKQAIFQNMGPFGERSSEGIRSSGDGRR